MPVPSPTMFSEGMRALAAGAAVAAVDRRRGVVWCVGCSAGRRGARHKERDDGHAWESR